MDLQLRGKVAFITGAAGGIGQETARVLLEEGARVAGADLNKDRVVSALQAAGGSAETTWAAAIDVTDEASVNAAVAGAVAHFGGLDIVVNAAGIYKIGELAEVDPAAWDQMLDINLRGTYLVCRAGLPQLVARKKGSIVNLSSISGRTKSTLATPSYVASKAGVIGLTMALASQNAKHGVRVNAVAPGPVDTEMIRGLPDELKPGLIGTIPMGRLGTAREIAQAIAFLVSDAAGFTTGDTMNINGGAFMV
jgi:NAD(P)-dependent dehydrogenase (short-subunit alcohol dehydrogenase family)